MNFLVKKWSIIGHGVAKRRHLAVYDMNFMENILSSLERSNSLPPFRRRGGRGKGQTAVRKPYRASQRHSEWKQEDVLQQWRHMKKACREKQKRPWNAEKWAWLISPMEWSELWAKCRPVPVGDGSFVPAHTKRGRNAATDVQLRRRDTGKPWTKDNIDIMYRGQSLLS